MASVLLSNHGSALLATLSRPSSLNSLTAEMLTHLSRVPSLPCSAVILRGAGGRAFCAGGDVRAIYDLRGQSQQSRFFRDEYFLDWSLARHAVSTAPHIAIWDGVVMGGGVGISAHAPLRVATERTLWAMPETAIGLLPDVGGSFFLPRLPHFGLGLYLGLTGARLSGPDSVHAGVASHFVSSKNIDALVADLAEIPSAESSSYAERLTAATLIVERHATPKNHLPSFSLAGVASDLIQRVFGCHDGGVRGLFSRLDKEANQGGALGKEAETVRTTLSRMSPTSLFITAEQFRRGAVATSSLGSCLATELRVVCAILSSPSSDFYEGVRAVLIDKGKGAPPAWSPASLNQVDEAAIIDFFDRGDVADGEEMLRKMGHHDR
jgi:enoyl-CoA hydratase/carnithine racemase